MFSQMMSCRSSLSDSFIPADTGQDINSIQKLILLKHSCSRGSDTKVIRSTLQGQLLPPWLSLCGHFLLSMFDVNLPDVLLYTPRKGKLCRTRTQNRNVQHKKDSPFLTKDVTESENEDRPQVGASFFLSASHDTELKNTKTRRRVAGENKKELINNNIKMSEEIRNRATNGK